MVFFYYIYHNKKLIKFLSYLFFNRKQVTVQLNAIDATRSVIGEANSTNRRSRIEYTIANTQVLELYLTRRTRPNVEPL